MLISTLFPASTTQDSPYIIGCIHQPTSHPKQLASALATTESKFILTLANNNQEIENHYIANGPLYARVLQYLNYDIAQDVYLRLPNQPDSVTAITASYPRQYGSTGRSSVLLVFPVPDKQLRNGCTVTFNGNKFELGTRRFIFTAQDIRTARQGKHAPK